MELSLFDLHCDTAFEMLRQKQPLTKNDLAVSLEKASAFRRYIQVMALWIPHSLSDSDGWQFCMDMLNNLRADPAVTSGRAPICTKVLPKEERTLILALEDARILDDSLERLDTLYKEGVRVLTPFWKELSCIGGAHDTNDGLTPFGRSVMERAIELGMILDISHASVLSSKDIFELSAAHSKPVIASHSNAHTVCPVSRNLLDWQIEAIVASGGIIGINLYHAFLETDGKATLDSILRHIEHFLSLGAQNALCLGCDMDGADLLYDIPDVSYLYRIAEHLLAHGYSQKWIDALFFENAYYFAQKHFS